MNMSIGGVRTVGALAMVAAVAAAAAGQSPTQEAQAWWRNAATFKTRYYRVRTDLPPDAARMVAGHMDHMCDAYLRMLAAFRISRPSGLEMWLFGSQRSYLTVIADRYDANVKGSQGVCISKGTRITLASWMTERDPEPMLQVMQHEGFHQFARGAFRSIPPWADEGLAQVFEHGILLDGEVLVGEVPVEWLAMLQAAVKMNRLRTFDAFMSMENEEWGDHVVGGTAQLNYLQAWGLVHFFLYADNARYQQRFMAFLGQLNRGNSWQGAYQHAFGTRDYAALQGAFVKYLMELQPTDLRLTVYRLKFLAEGAKALAEKDTYPETLEEMREHLTAMAFVHEIHHGRRTLRISAKDPSSYAIPLCGGDEAVKFELLPWETKGKADDAKSGGWKRGRKRRASSTPDEPLPRRIVTTGLFPRTFRIDWKRDRRGKLSYVLVTD